MRPVLALVLTLTGCWKADPVALSADVIPYLPAAGTDAPGSLYRLTLPLQCPDGRDALAYAIVPDSASGPTRAALLLHSGAFDYVRDPLAADPLYGAHLHTPSRMDRDWAVRQAFATLGMYDAMVPAEDQTGAMAAALVDAGIAVLAPINCWGDMWHNDQDAANDVAVEHLDREGRAAAALSWRLLSEPGFAATQGISLPFQADTAHLYALGLGSGGQGVAELLHAGYTPAAILVDSYPDDLSPWWGTPELFAPIATGLDRLYPEGDSGVFSLSAAATIPPTWYLYSSQDDLLPSGAHTNAIAVLGPRQDAVVQDLELRAHVLTGSDPELAAEITAWLRSW
ncbi:MAG: hypothetical protein JXX28_06025 [Deltaproteobacteria bacterium]|nr:hypothetical protein [Deltaproteobacteria bacterium]